MKSAVFSGFILVLLFVFVFINTVVVDRMLDETIDKAESLNISERIDEDFNALLESYERHAKYINLTVSHVMMSEVEEAFAELGGAVKSDDKNSFIQAKSRLVDALGQLRRLAGLSLDSII